MLYALSIRSFVLIDRLDVEASDGFTALTGETGAGKSIILDALSIMLGGSVSRDQIRAGADQATLAAEFALDPDHAAWKSLECHGVAFSKQETLLLKRTIPRKGPSRAFINGQPVAAATLAELGQSIVEIHGQHAASHLLKPSTHLDLLDAFAGHMDLVVDCETGWRDLDAMRTSHAALEQNVQSARDRRDWLTFAVQELTTLAPESGEVETLTAQRSVLLQSERITDSIDEATRALDVSSLEDPLTCAAKSVDRILRIPGLEQMETGMAPSVSGAADAVDRALIELNEARSAVQALGQFAMHDPARLEAIESRLFALRAAARKFDCQPEDLADRRSALEADLALCSAETEALQESTAAVKRAETAWSEIAQRLSAQRQSAAKKLEAAIHKELSPLHLERVSFRVAFAERPGETSGAKGKDHVCFEVETNPGGGYGALNRIASGGELARFSLALKCALSQSGGAQTLIFDEADQGVGGAVAAAIGERLAKLAGDRQVFAVTHSPQVASAANRQWRVLKETDRKGQTISHIAQLDDGQRLEEIARMLSGSSITDEARAAASKLLEAA
ncbi:MAG: DNA repair protein RecN [Pseudomonadota bacterium]